MAVVNIHEAKTRLSRLVDQALSGQEVTIAKAGRPMVKLVPIAALVPRTPGIAKGKVTKAFFEDLPEEELAAWQQ